MIDQVAAQSTLKARGPESHMLASRAHHRCLALQASEISSAQFRVERAWSRRAAVCRQSPTRRENRRRVGIDWSWVAGGAAETQLGGRRGRIAWPAARFPSASPSRPPGHRRRCVGVSRHLVDRSHMWQAIELFLQLPPSPLASSAALNPASSCSAAFHASDSPDARRVFPWLRHGLAETHPACSLAFSARTPNGIHGGPWTANLRRAGISNR